MNTNIKCIFAFVVGTAVGSAVAWRVLNAKYERLVQEEIDSVKEAFRKYNEGDIEEPQENTSDSEEHPDFRAFRNRAREHGYTDYGSMFNGTKCDSNQSQEHSKEEKDVEKPYVISPDEFGEMYDYECISLNHYADGVLADDDDEIVDDVDNCVGSDYAEHFGDYEPDTVHIRNDRLKCDYEICRDERTFSEVCRCAGVITKDDIPHRVED